MADDKPRVCDITASEIEDLMNELDRLAERFPLIATLFLRLVEAQNVWAEDHELLHGAVVPQIDFTNEYLFEEGSKNKEDMN